MKKLLALLLFCLIPRLAFGAVAKDVDSSGSGSITDNITWSHTVTGSDTILVCLAAISAGGNVSAFTFNGISLTAHASRDNGVSYTNHRIEMWYLIAPAGGGVSHTVSLTLASAANELVGGCTSFTGAHQATPLGTAVANSADGDVESSPFLPVTVPASGMAYGGVVFGNSAGACTATTPNSGGMTAGFDTCVGSAGDNASGASATRTATGDFSWINLSGAFAAAVAAPISQAAAPGAIVRRKAIVIQ